MQQKAAIGIIAASLFIAAGCSARNYDAFAQCLTSKGAVAYGTDWCSKCQEQKSRFSGSFKYINFVDCGRNTEECLKKGIKGYPTWIINGTQYRGVQSLSRLSALTGCELQTG
jgi:hypothetical protein